MFDVQKTRTKPHSRFHLIKKMGSFVGFRSENPTHEGSDSPLIIFVERDDRNRSWLPRRPHWTLDVGRWTFNVKKHHHPPTHKSTHPPHRLPLCPIHHSPFDVPCSMFDVHPPLLTIPLRLPSHKQKSPSYLPA